MALSERLALLVTLDSQGAVRGLESVGKAADRNLGRLESKLDRAGQRFQKAGVGMLATSGLLAAGLFKAGQSAADLEQAVGGTEAVFKDASGTIDKFAKDSARNMGLSERAFREATTRIGGQLKGVGFDIDTAAEKSIELTGVAADLAATFGGTTAEAVDALSAAMRGEADPAERFNLRLNQTAVNAKAVELGLAESTSAVDANAKAQAILALITEQSADAQGQFAREAGTAAGQMQIANAEFENAKAALGQSVAPIIANVAGGLADLSGGFRTADEASGGLLSKLATFGTIGLGAAGGISFVVGKAIELRDHVRKAGDALRGLGAVKIGAGALGIAGLTAALIGLEAVLSDMKAADSFNDQKVNRWAEAIKSGATATEALADEIRETGKLEVGLAGMADDVTLALDRMGLDIEEFIDLTRKSEDEITEWAKVNNQAGDDSIVVMEAAIQTKKDLAAAEELAAAKADVYGASQADASTKTEGLTEKVDEQKEALEGLLDATLAMFDANLGYRNSVDDVEDKLADLVELQKEGKRGTEEYEDALRTAEGAIIDQAAAAVRLFEDTAKANGQTLTAAQRAGIFKTELEKLAAGLAPGSPLRVQLEAYIAQLGRIPAEKTTTVNLRLGNTITGFKGDQLIAGTRASGGPVSAGQTYLVGEQGPELLHMGSTGGFVSPNSALTSGGNTINITVSALDPGAAARAVMDALKSAGIRGVAA